MENLSKYKISFTGLSIGEHRYNFELDDAFFEFFDKSEITHARINLDLVMEKSNSMMVLDFNLSGKVELICDRCSEMYWQIIETSNRLFIKFGNAYYEQSDDIIVIPDNETHFDIAQYIYEFIHLNLPIRRLHRGGKEKSDNCDPDILKKIEKLNVKTDDQGIPKTGRTDQWEVLKKLKNN